MPTPASDIVYDKDGNVVSRTDYVIPDTRLDMALAWLVANDPAGITTLAQARPFLVAYRKILIASLRMQKQGRLDEPDDGTTV